MGLYEKRTFRVWWAAWLVTALANFVGQSLIGPHSVLIAQVQWAAFLVGEAWGAYRGTTDDTLSEFSAWLSGLASVRTHDFRDQMASALAGFYATYLGWVVTYGIHGQQTPVNLVCAAVIAPLVWLWLRDHFQNLVHGAAA